MGAHAQYVQRPDDPPLEIGAPELDLVETFRRLWLARTRLREGTDAYAHNRREMAIVLSNYRDRVEAYARTKDDAFLVSTCARIQASYGEVALVMEPLNAVVERVLPSWPAARRVA
ncbi:hypothetical protein JCM10450v2_007619 [Rhodotorula kratochvilovae]